MKKSFVAPLGLALLCAAPLSAQNAQQMSQEQLIQWATDRGTCGENSVVDAKYLDDGRVQVTCGHTGAGAAAGGAALAGGLAGTGGALAAVVGVVVVAAAAGAGGSSNTTN